MSPEEQAGVRLLTEAYERWGKMPPISLTMTRVDVYTLMMACQTMLTHPGITPQMAKNWEHLGRQFMEAVCDTPEIYAMSESGWNRALDVEPEDPAERQREGAEVTVNSPCTKCGGTPSEHIGWAKGHLYTGRGLYRRPLGNGPTP